MSRYFKKLGIPYLVWLFLLAIVPAIIMVVLSFLDCEGTDFSSASLTLVNFAQFGYSSTLIAFLNSLYQMSEVIEEIPEPFVTLEQLQAIKQLTIDKKISQEKFCDPPEA